MGARLARYTGNETYAKTVEKTWDFVRRVKYVDDNFNVYDGAHLPTCADINKAQFSYNAAMLIQGSAFLYNMVGSFMAHGSRAEKRTGLTRTVPNRPRTRSGGTPSTGF